jgi:hypothetical protein
VSARSALGALLGAVLLVTGCSSDGQDTAATSGSASPSASSSPTPTPSAAPTPVAAPQRGVCRQMTYADAVAPTSAAAEAPCPRRHTAETYAVGQLKTVVGGHLLAVDAASVQQQVATSCPQRLARWAGGSEDDLRLSMLRSVWFTPTVEDSDAGANWYRCDVIVVARADTLAPVAGSLEGALGTSEGRERYGMCGTAAPGSPGFTQVLCRAPHTWRAISTVPLDAGPYPGEKAVRAAGQDVCDDAAQALAADALDYQWGYEWPTSEQWSAGQTYGRCWAPDDN